VFFAVLWLISPIFPFPSFNEQFNINWFLESFFTGLNNGPTPFKLIDWSGFIRRAQLFNYHTNSIPAVDIACFFWTFGNISLLIAAAYVAFWFIYYLWLILLAIVVFAFSVFGLIIATISAVRQWMRFQTLRILGERQDDILETQKVFKQRIDYLKYKNVPDWLKKNKWVNPPPPPPPTVTSIQAIYGKQEAEEKKMQMEMERIDMLLETDSDTISDTLGFSTKPVQKRKWK
jgi:hypothetical protein